MDIRIIYNVKHPNATQIETACKIMNTVQRFFYFTTVKDDGIILNGDESNPTLFLQNHTDDNSYKVFITDKRFADKWFSHESQMGAIITTSDWLAEFSPPSLKSYIMYQCAQAALGFAADLSEDVVMNFIHYDPEGCMFDMCGNKSDIKLGMMSGAICPVCRGILRKYGTDELSIDATERILNYVRHEAIGKPMVVNNEAFVVMRFTTNDENDNAYQYGIKPAFAELRIKETRADATIESRPLLDKIRQSIEKSRFIVVKVDEKNLNVYFELGLAMGLNKDVLLISEQGLVVDLPTDLKNWECLTYPKGGYSALKDNIIRFFKDNYHLYV